MSERLISDVDVGKIAKRVTDAIKENKEAGNNPETEDTVRNLIDAELETIEKQAQQKAEEKLRKESEKKAEKARQNAEFNVNVAALGAVNAPDYSSGSKLHGEGDPYSFRAKMMQNKHDLAAFHGGDIAQRIEEIKVLHDKIYIAGKILAQERNMPYGMAVYGMESFKQLRERVNDDPELAKAINTTTTAQGLELIPTGMSSRLIERFDLSNRMFDLFEPIPMPTNPYKLPVDTGDAASFIITETTADDPANSDRVGATTPPTGNFTFTAVGLGNRVRVSYQAEEDAVLSVIPLVENRMLKAMNDGFDDAVINGDSDGTHQDSDTQSGASNLPAKAWDGLRKYGLGANPGTVDFAGGNPTLALMESLLKKSGDYPAEPENNAWILGAKVYTGVRLAEGLGVVTRDKIGDRATILTGQVAEWFGSPVITAKKARENLNDSGVYDGVTTTKAVILYVHRPGFLLGLRGGILLETDRDIETQQTILVASRRYHFKSPWDPTAAAYPFVVAGIDVKTT